MQRMAADVWITQGSARTVHKLSRRSSSRPKRSAEAFGVETLAPPAVLSLPSLQGIPASLNHEINGDLLYQLAATMTRLGLVSPDLYDPAKAVIEFVQSAVVSAIGQRRIRLLKETIGYCVELADKPRTRTLNNTIEGVEGLLFKVACSEFGYLEMGAVVEAMEADTPGLGAAFYRTLIHTINSVMRVYDYTDALYCEENTREMAEQDGDNEGAYEITDIKSELPECLRKSPKRSTKRILVAWRRTLQAHRNGRFSEWISMVRRLLVLSRFAKRDSENFIEDDYYDDPPVPSLLICFRQHDGVVRCFDEEAEYWSQGSPRPAVCLQFEPTNTEEVARTLRVAYRFFQFNFELCRLVESIRRWETRSVRQRKHRGNPSLPAQ